MKQKKRINKSHWSQNTAEKEKFWGDI